MTGGASHLVREVLTAPGQLAERSTAWDRLAAAWPSPFSGSAWLRAWWEVSDRPLECRLLSDPDGTLRAGALVRRSAAGVRGAADVHTGDWGVFGDPPARAALWRDLGALARPVGRLVLPVLEQGALLEARTALEPLGYRFVPLDRLDSPVLELPGSYDALLAGTSRNLRSQLARSRRALERSGRLELRTTTGGPRLDPDLEALLQLEASGWKGRAGTAVLCTSRTATLYRRFARLAAAAGSLRLHLLTLDGVAVAGDLAHDAGGRRALVKTAFSEHHQGWRPGLVLRAEALRSAIDEGAAEYDFLGGPDAYKLRWGAAVRPRWTTLAVRGPWRAEAVLHERVRPALGTLRRQVRRAGAAARPVGGPS